MKRKIEIRQQASWIFRVKPRKILKAIDNELQDEAELLQTRRLLCRFYEKEKVATSVQDKEEEKEEEEEEEEEEEADMAVACFFPAEACNEQNNNDACPLHTKPEMVASTSNGCGVSSSMLSSLDTSLNPNSTTPHPVRLRSRTRSLAAFPDSLSHKGRGEGNCFNGDGGHSHCTKNKDSLRDMQKCPEFKKMLLTGEDCHEDQSTSCTALSFHFRRSRFRRLSPHMSAGRTCIAVPPPDSGEESSQCDNFGMGQRTAAFSDKNDAATSATKDAESMNPNPERTLESPEDLADRGALDLLLSAIQATTEDDMTGAEEASNVPLLQSHFIFGSFPIKRKRVVRHARSTFQHCSQSVKETTRTSLPLQKRIRKHGDLEGHIQYNTELFPAKLHSINNSDDNATPVLRSKRGRARALPMKFCDSVLQPWY